jgi:cbb3-type cytochrome c oxidase subunit III
MLKREWSGLLTAVALVAFTACGDAEPDAQQQDTQGAPAAPAQQVGANVALPEGVTLDMVQQGKQVFETTTCFTCHGMDATGTTLAPSLRDQNWLNSDGSFDGIVGTVRTGVAQPVEYPGMMPAMGGASLSDDQIRAVAAYVYAISHGG